MTGDVVMRKTTLHSSSVIDTVRFIDARRWTELWRSLSCSTPWSSSVPGPSGWPPPPTPPSAAWTSSSSRPGRDAGAAVGEWAHVRLFSAWRELIDPAARRLLEAAGTWTAPDEDAYPTGGEWREQYLQPLADLLDATPGGAVRYGARVTGVSRAGRDLLVDSGRESDPFAVHIETPHRPRAPAGQRRGGRLRHLDTAQPARRGRLPGAG